MNATFNGYAVFFFPQALEALGAAIAPYVQDSPAGPHVLCREIDTGGALIELTMDGKTADGQPIDLELMLPTSMVRMIVSARSDQVFGFGPRTPVAPMSGEAPVVDDGPGPAHAPEQAPEARQAREPTPMARRGHPSPAGRAAHKASDARRRPARSGKSGEAAAKATGKTAGKAGKPAKKAAARPASKAAGKAANAKSAKTAKTAKASTPATKPAASKKKR